MCVNISTTEIANSKCEKLLGIKIDINLNFEPKEGHKEGRELDSLSNPKKGLLLAFLVKLP